MADNAKIIGGSEVLDRTQWPWMVSIGDFCGGSIVGDRWVLTGKVGRLYVKLLR